MTTALLLPNENGVRGVIAAGVLAGLWQRLFT